VRIEVARCEQNALAVGRKIAAGRAAVAGADALRADWTSRRNFDTGSRAPRLRFGLVCRSSNQRLRIDLIERIVDRLRLIDDLLAVGREISFAGFDEAAGDLADVGEEFGLDGVLGRGRN